MRLLIQKHFRSLRLKFSCLPGRLAVKIRLFLGLLMAEDGCFFKLLYWLYTNTRLGKLYVRRDIRCAHRKFRGTGCHSAVVAHSYGSIKIIPVPQVYDNYGYIVTDTNTGDTVVIDVTDVAVVKRCLEQYSVKPSAILSTHKHWDHCCGTKDLKSAYPSLEVYGSSVDKPYGTTKFLSPNDKVQIGSLKFLCHMTPGHTRGHTVFSLDHPKSLFTGDLLFIGGCGKVFEGTTEVMLESLDLISQFEDSTLIWPGHEYATNNLRFANELDIGNSALQEKLNWVYQRLEERLPACPSTLGEEKLYNPFLRTADPSLLMNVGLLMPPTDNDSLATPFEAELTSAPSNLDSDSISTLPYIDSVSFHSCVELDPSVAPVKDLPSEAEVLPATDSSALLEPLQSAGSLVIKDEDKKRLRISAFQLIRRRKNRFDKLSK